MDITRTKCVLCENEGLKPIYTLIDYPISATSSDLEETVDEYKDCIFSSCLQCGCVQLKNLINPEKLYANSHNSTENTPTWKRHHAEFATFIQTIDTSGILLEIGGNSGVLYNLLENYAKEYTIMDICNSPLRPKKVKFIQGNCESLAITGNKCVIMSHTFEHLYNPRKLINNLLTSGVNSVFISIPNMDSLYNTKNISILHNEHTFFVGDYEIKFMFEQYGYTCSHSQDFRNHSRFYHFIRDNLTTLAIIPKQFSYTEGIQNILLDYEMEMANIKIDTPCFICPGGHYGQKIYYYLRKYNKYIKGFLDNDSSKQGHRLYGTPVLTYSPNELLNYSTTPITIILYAGPYTEELKTQLLLIHSSITFISIGNI